MGLQGRGKNYSALKEIVENTMIAVYGEGWPAKAARAFGFQRDILVREQIVPIRGLPAGQDSIRMAFISDLHAGPTTCPNLLLRTVDLLKKLQPDLLLIGGDFVFLEARHIDFLAEALAEVRPPLGSYAVPGNHDLWADDAHIEKALAAAGIRMLINEGCCLPEPFESVSLCGLDDWYSGEPDAQRAFGERRHTDIVLMHQPSNLLDLRGRSFDLALCGHVHGGQIALPGGFPLIVPAGPLSRKYNRGWYTISENGHSSLLYVSTGVGCVALPFRLFAPAEILLCTLIPARTRLQPKVVELEAGQQPAETPLPPHDKAGVPSTS